MTLLPERKQGAVPESNVGIHPTPYTPQNIILFLIFSHYRFQNFPSAPYLEFIQPLTKEIHKIFPQRHK
jgi:hypothetical protein